MEATIIINSDGLANKGNVAGVVATVKEQHILYYDSGVGLYYRVNNKVETIATKVNQDYFDLIKEKIQNLRESSEKAVSFNIWFKSRKGGE
ncbi:hypothetical protein [Staphylococcus shinii]|uniref:hypothetical protein n=1 Tax=Staphylococcus shinii TaxID=2912228 RepID=UPI003EEDC4C2